MMWVSCSSATNLNVRKSLSVLFWKRSDEMTNFQMKWKRKSWDGISCNDKFRCSAKVSYKIKTPPWEYTDKSMPKTQTKNQLLFARYVPNNVRRKVRSDVMISEERIWWCVDILKNQWKPAEQISTSFYISTFLVLLLFLLVMQVLLWWIWSLMIALVS